MGAKLSDPPVACALMKKPLGQRIAMVVAICCYAAAAVCGIAAWFYQGDSPEDPVSASLMASVVFFVGCGAVLHTIGKARLTGVLSGSGRIDDD